VSDHDDEIERDESPGVYPIGCYASERSDRDAPAALAVVDRDAARTDGLTPFVASTSREDRHRSVINQDEWKLASFRRNPVILWQHGRHAPPVGRAVDVRIADRGKPEARLTLSVDWDRESPNGAIIGSQFDRGFLSAGSVGFRPVRAPVDRSKLEKDHPAYRAPKEDDSPWWPALYYSGTELLEFSAVTVPSNVDAQAIRAYAFGAEDPAEQERRAIVETLARDPAALVLRALREGTPAQRAQIRQLLLGAPAPTPTPTVHDMWTDYYRRP